MKNWQKLQADIITRKTFFTAICLLTMLPRRVAYWIRYALTYQKKENLLDIGIKKGVNKRL